MTDFLLPPRSIVSLRPVEGGVEVQCDCGFGTRLDFSDVPVGGLPVESAFTCDGCLSVHWFTLTEVTGGAS